MRRGFTLIELMVTLAIVVVLAVVALTNLSGRRGKGELDGATRQIGALLREAQSNAMAQAQGTSWGVHLENATTTAPFYALFASSAYATSAIIGYYRLPASVAYDTASLALGASIDIIFSQIVGAASASTSIRLYVLAQTSLSSTISIASSGAISY